MLMMKVINKKNGLSKTIDLKHFDLIECVKIFRFYKNLKYFMVQW